MSKPLAYVLMRDGEVDYDSDSGCISNIPGDTLDESYEWVPVYAAPQPEIEPVAWVDVPEGDQQSVHYGFYSLRGLKNLEAGKYPLYTRPADITALQQDYIELHNKHLYELSRIKLLRSQLETVRLQRDKELKEKCEALAEVERLKSDAERFKYVLSQIPANLGDIFCQSVTATDDDIIEAIDAARTAKQEQQP